MSKGREVAPVQTSRIQVPGIAQVSDPGELAELEGVVGAGLSESVEDRGTPLIYIAQKGSPQIDDKDAKFLKDLKVGMAFNNLTGEMYDTEHEGVDFLPCFMRVTWDEWTPRDEGGGFHGSHHRNTDLIKTAKPFQRKPTDKPRRDIYVMPNGHELKLTAKYYGVIAKTWSPVIIPMASTSLGCSTRLQAMMEAQKIEVQGRIVPKPGFWTVYNLKTVYEKNDDGTWYQWAVGGITGPNLNKDLRSFCKTFAIACARNEVKESSPVQEVGTAPKDDDIPV